ncbi:tyrosine-type recombinase/integrase [Paenibacillus sp. NEAU-GSW1]|uniref:tyrosine-type recombinase/integrase n=1 Tax=Paenibacillus sp. NEAU-GSW1 TaxID=2682486 RepID=UPI0012E2817B|nr:tyrosine-type recombinase/integrase [Paenibacillus sp. NEAU-GSW1]MUT67106.1 tyrosine-type recombinase/integrase [Paenibacillus sp. NEAU-GSW1]
MKVQEKKDYETLQMRINSFPSFVMEFIHYKLNDDRSPSSMLEYLRDYDHFFWWMVWEVFVELKEIKEISICQIDELTVQHIRNYERCLRITEKMSERSVSRKLHSIRSLFNYLHDIAENEKGNPLIKSNVFRKFILKRAPGTLTVARTIHEKDLLTADESNDFIDYIQNRYRNENKKNPQAIWNYDRNKERDVCIINLILGSGLLVSDIVNLDIEDISLNDNQVNITRQWSAQRSSHYVLISNSANNFLKKYIDLRRMIYQPTDDESALFLAVKNGQKIGNRITKRAVQAMVLKYADKYGKPELTTRQLRYSFGLEYQKQSNYVQTKQQLALRNIEATEKYQILSELLE